MELQKKNRAPLTYSNTDVFIQAFEFDGETYISIDNKGQNFISLNSTKEMNIYDLEKNSDKIDVLTVPNVDDISKKYFIGRVVKSNGKNVKITRIFLEVENNKIQLKMNNTNVNP